MSDRDHLEAIGVAVSGRLHLGLDSSVDLLVELLEPMSRYDVVQASGKLMAWLERATGGGLRAGQPELVAAVFPDPQKGKLLELLAAGSGGGGIDAVFYPQQLMALQRIAAHAASDVPVSSFDDGERWEDFLSCCGIVADLISELSSFPIRDVHRQLGTLPKRELAAFHIRNSAANRIVFFKAAAGRAFRLWLDSPLPWPTGLPTVEDLAQERLGVSMNRYLAVGIAPAFARLDVNEPDPSAAVLDVRTYFKDSAVPADEAMRILDHLTFDPDLDPATPDSPATYWDFRSTASRPYFRAAPNLLIPASVGRAFERVTTGLFWLLHEQMAAEGRVTELTDHFGAMFESYCLRVVKSIASADVLVSGEVVYRSGMSDVKSSDVLVAVVGPPTGRLLVECAALRPRASLFADGDLDAFDDYLDRIVGKLGQLDRVCSDLEAGLFTIPGDALPSGAPLFPVLVVDTPFEWSPQLRDVIEERISDAGYFRHGDVGRVTVCDVGELEHLVAEFEAGANPIDVIRSYVASGRSQSIEWYLHKQYDRLDAPSFVNDGFRFLTELILEDLDFSSSDH